MVSASGHSVLFNAVLLLTDAKSLLLPSEKDQLVSKVINDVVALLIKLLNIELFDAMMSLKLVPCILLVADLAHHLHLWAVSLNVVVQLRSSQVLELFSVADVASEFRALVLSMSLQFSQGLPDNLGASFRGPASMRELTEVNAVTEHLVHLLHEVALGLAVGAADVVLWGHEFSLSSFALAT